MAKKIAALSIRDLISFRASAKLHRRLSEDVEVLRDVSDDCLRLLLLPLAQLRAKTDHATTHSRGPCALLRR